MLEHLARVVLRQRVDEPHLLGHLELGHAVRHQELVEVGDLGPPAAGGDNGRAGVLPGAGIGDPDDRDLRDLWMRDEDVFDFLGRDVLSVADDDVLGAACHDEVPVVGEPAQVAGAEIAGLVEGPGAILGVQVPAEHLRPAGADLAVDDDDLGDSGAAVGVGGPLRVVQ